MLSLVSQSLELALRVDLGFWLLERVRMDQSGSVQCCCDMLRFPCCLVYSTCVSWAVVAEIAT